MQVKQRYLRQNKFVRTNPDGSLDKRVIKYSKKHKRGSYQPFLRSGDLIL